MKDISITFTQRQLEVLTWLIGEVANHSDVMESVFPDAQERRMAKKVVEKIEFAHNRLQHRNSLKPNTR